MAKRTPVEKRPTAALHDTPAASPAPPSPPSADETAARLTVQLTKDGKAIDWQKVRESRRPELRAILAASGVTPAAPARSDKPLLNAALASTLYDLLAQIEALVAARMFGCSSAEAFDVLKLSDAEKASLADPTARVVEKYLPASLIDKYADEFLLVMMLGTTTRAKFSTLQEHIAARKPVLVRRHETHAEVKTENDKI